MLAMQYSIQLPEDYDLQLIHERVAQRSKLFDSLPGMSHKAYLLDEADKIYAPFYIWSDVEEAQKFLFDDLFTGVIRAFRRPRVRTWFTLAKGAGASKNTPLIAVKEIDIIPPESVLEDVVKAERAEHAALLADYPQACFRCVAFDADRWEIVRYTLWDTDKPPVKPGADCVENYRVLHVHDS